MTITLTNKFSLTVIIQHHLTFLISYAQVVEMVSLSLKIKILKNSLLWSKDFVAYVWSLSSYIVNSI